jgi:hypothetical protein
MLTPALIFNFTLNIVLAVIVYQDCLRRTGRIGKACLWAVTGFCFSLLALINYCVLNDYPSLGYLVCPHCGQKSNRPGAIRVCPHCFQSMEKATWAKQICPSCHREYYASVDTCPFCKTQLRDKT